MLMRHEVLPLGLLKHLASSECSWHAMLLTQTFPAKHAQILTSHMNEKSVFVVKTFDSFNLFTNTLTIIL